MLEFTVPHIYLLELLCPSLSSAASQQTNQSTHIHKFGHIWHTHPQQHTHTPKYLYRLVWVHIYRIPRMHVGRIENTLHIISASLTSNLKPVYHVSVIQFVLFQSVSWNRLAQVAAPIGSTPLDLPSRKVAVPNTSFSSFLVVKKHRKIQNPSHVGAPLHKKNWYILT